MKKNRLLRWLMTGIAITLWLISLPFILIGEGLGIAGDWFYPKEEKPKKDPTVITEALEELWEE